MSTYVALLRGVNVGGRKLPMADLRATFDGLGHTGVRTYIQSGNVVFTAKTGSKEKVRATIERAIERDSGLDVSVLLRTPAEMSSVLKRNPFGVEAYVTFLDAKPTTKQVAGIEREKYMPDEFVVDGREVFLRCPNGYGNTKINNALFERKLATRATTRNWKTVKLLEEWANTPS
jgi:uncharacterized protein (DUF1697 family)